MIAPGQRLDILADFSDAPIGESLKLKSFRFAADGGGMHSGGVRQGDELDLLQIYVDRPGEQSAPVPSELAPFRPWKAEDAIRTRQFSLSFARMRHYINGRLFSLNRSDFQVTQGDLEIWEYRNTANVFHPMHMHGVILHYLPSQNLALFLVSKSPEYGAKLLSQRPKQDSSTAFR